MLKLSDNKLLVSIQINYSSEYPIKKGIPPVIMPPEVQAFPFLMLRIMLPHQILPTLQIVNGRCLLLKYYLAYITA